METEFTEMIQLSGKPSGALIVMQYDERLTPGNDQMNIVTHNMSDELILKDDLLIYEKAKMLILMYLF
jgi:hypothetical protein